jgi:uncharacterized protein (DUF488 family)
VRLLTVGHGTATPEELSARLVAARVELLVDVRRFPGSRRHPHLSREGIAEWVPVDYRWEERLGGRRPLPPDSPDVALRNASFRGYASWMRGADFRAALEQVLAEPRRSAVMCSESVWWRCHRRMVADAAALLHDVEVLHLMPDGRLTPHPPTDGVRVAGDSLVYDEIP